MADRIRLLPEVVANQIAAGEVVNRPSSVVKEMMENAIDAGAETVKVNFRDGGKELIQVADDGCGMSPIDARMAFDRHATSKIKTVDDIYALNTFGFRGEALASIAAVAQVELRTRQENSDVGTCVAINGGQFTSQTSLMCPVGSQFFVRNLFYNVPARRRFLDKSTVSAAQIKAEFQRVALCNPQVAFELYANDAPVYALGATSLAGRIVDVVGRSIKQNLLEVEAQTSIASIKGYIGRPAAAKRRNTEQYLFVNGRYFRSNYLTSAVIKAYEKLISESCAPSYFLYLTIDASRIDVNVHPQKTEVKFADQEAVWQIIHAAVRETLAKTGAVPLMDFDSEGSVEIPVLRQGATYSEPRAVSNPDYNPFRALSDAFEEFESGGDFVSGESELDFIASETVEQQRLPIDERAHFTEFLPLAGGYIAALLGGRLVVVDARRARERILYETYLQMLGYGSSVSQQLLFAERLSLSEDEYALLEENAVDFAALGFDIDFQGAGVVEVRGVPADMPAETDRLIYELLQIYSTPLPLMNMQREKIAAVMARSGAQRFGGSLSRADAETLLSQLSESENISFSPSGKAIMAEITQEEIINKLKM